MNKIKIKGTEEESASERRRCGDRNRETESARWEVVTLVALKSEEGVIKRGLAP
jgi:hypothetical protein